MVRQAVFNMVGPRVLECMFFDIFAGSGSVGLEALSRGAARAVFVEKNPRELDLIRKNVVRTRFESQCGIRRADAFVWGRHFQPEEAPTIVFLGPPYPLFDSDAERLFALVAGVQEQIRVGDVLIFQFPREIPRDRIPRFDEWNRCRTYGKTGIGIWAPG